jgi:hypothetical protein
VIDGAGIVSEKNFIDRNELIFGKYLYKKNKLQL